MRKIIMLSLLAVIAMTVHAQAPKYVEFPDNPTSYLQKQSSLAVSPSSACNQGDEPFTAFLKKWNTDADFRSERVWAFGNEWFSADDRREMTETSLGFLKDYKVLPVAAQAGRNYRTFYGVTENTVGFCQEGAIINFQRIEGKWYVVFLGLAG